MDHCFDYTGKRVVITGAYSGVGAALLDVLAELGRPEVIALDIKEPEGPIQQFVETDMGKAASVEAAIEAIDDADLGDEDAELVVGDAQDHDLAWYATQELPFLLELL